MSLKFQPLLGVLLFSVSVIGSACGASDDPVAGGSPSAQADRPNFIFIITDDQRWDAMGVVQEEQDDQALFPWLQTPHMDRLASQGARFRNAFVVHSLCSPSRASFLSGQQTYQHGVRHNSQPMPLDLPSWATALRDAGYETGYFGKWHMGRQRKRPGFTTVFSYVGQGIYQDCVFLDNGNKAPTRGWVDDVTTDHAIDYIKANKEQPFGMVIGYKSPHEPRKPPARRSNDYTDAELIKPASYMVIPPFRPAGYKPLNWRSRIHDRKNYFRCITAIDDCLGRILDTLDQTGLTENTVVIFVGDNGYFLGEHALHDKRYAYEESLRIPLLVRYPKMIKPGTLIDAMALNIDLAPTILELAGLGALPDMTGKSWVPVLQDPMAGIERESFLYENYRDPEFPKVTFDLFALRTATMKLITYPGHAEWSELFDLSRDPLELTNIIDRPGFASDRETLVRQLEAALRTAGLEPVLTSE